MATIIDGKKLAADVRNRAAAEVEGLTKQGIACGLVVVLVGDCLLYTSSILYVIIPI